MEKSYEAKRMLDTAYAALRFWRKNPDQEGLLDDLRLLVEAICRQTAIHPPALQADEKELEAWLDRIKHYLDGASGFRITPNPLAHRNMHNICLVGYDKSSYLDYPSEVIIETTGVCNAHCTFCPHERLERRQHYMDDGMFDRIVEQLKEIPEDHIYRISPFKVNELLMDKQIFKRIRQINESLPNALIRIFSNFNAAGQEAVEQICAIKNLVDINISLNSLDAEEYRELMGLDLSRTLNNIKLLLNHIKTHGLTTFKSKIGISRVSVSRESDMRFIQAFKETFSPYLDIVECSVLTRGEWIDFMPSAIAQGQNRNCPRWTELNICCDGRVAFCCMDGECNYCIGDLRQNRILDIYNSPEYRRLRTEDIVKSEVLPCKRCSI